MSDAQETDKNIEIWKIKKLIKTLESARGNGTGMISLIMPPRDQIARVAKMLGDEYGTASNIKSRVNRQSVLGAITSAQQRIKLYNKVPPNGLLLIFRPSLYLCDNKFHTEALSELLAGEENRRPNKNRTLANPPVFAKNWPKKPTTFIKPDRPVPPVFGGFRRKRRFLKLGFLVMDGNGTLFGTLSGQTREVLHKFTVDLPKKHGRGGQSALRFARLRMERRHNYVRKTAELATQVFINPATNQPNVAGLILAGSADFKTVEPI
jgi:peptide chain release factor subunit 1